MQVYTPRAAAPVIRVSVPRAAGPVKRRSSGRRRSGGAGSGGSLKDTLIKVAVGGAALAWLDKSGTKVPTVPMLGKAGTIAVAAYFLGGKKPGLVRDVCISATVLAAYQFIKDGSIAGDDE